MADDLHLILDPGKKKAAQAALGIGLKGSVAPSAVSAKVPRWSISKSDPIGRFFLSSCFRRP